MPIVLALAVLLLAASGEDVLAQPLPVPARGGSCPHGYLWSAGQCIPSGRDAPLAVPQVRGSCPSGWLASAGACIKSQERRPSR
jgi:hypothetical protein